MILEATRIYADWLKGVTKDFSGVSQGVNVWLAKMPRDGSDGKPPDVKDVYDLTRSHELATGRIEATFPILAVVPNGPFDAAGEVQTIYRDAPMYTQAVRYMTKDYERMEAMRDALYTLRAVVASLRQFMADANQAAWTRNNIGIMAASKMTIGPAYQQHGDYATLAAVLVTMKLRDLQP